MTPITPRDGAHSDDAATRDELLDLLASTEDAQWRFDVQDVLKANGYVYKRGVWVKP